MVGTPGLLEKIKNAELTTSKRVFELDNVSRRPYFDGFSHVSVKGNLKVEVTSERIFATANVEEAMPDEWQGNSEEIKRKMNSAYRKEITGALNYRPGEKVTLYSYPGDSLPGWSFHCKLEK